MILMVYRIMSRSGRSRYGLGFSFCFPLWFRFWQPDFNQEYDFDDFSDTYIYIYVE